ncbi:MAG TPA: SPOR domain-containing protein [Cyclobacteriaceae bacterium]|nr:SPOR domain-containing protein [Cyclobacteriaceae bacterium]
MNIKDYIIMNWFSRHSVRTMLYVKSVHPFTKLSLLILLLNVSCAAQNSISSGIYDEDISSLRPKFTAPLDSQKKAPETNYHTLNVVPTKNVNPKVDPVLDSINKLNLTRRYVDGFTIQVYSGQSREEAENAKKKILDTQGMASTLKYEQPKFRVTVGSYFTKLDAQKDLTRLRKSFSAAIVVPERILIR